MRVVFWVVAIVFLGLACICHGAEKRSSEPPAEIEVAEAVDSLIESMTLSERVSQLMIVTLQGIHVPDSSDRDLIKRYPPGGVIIPAVMQPATAAEYISKLRSMPIETKKKLPLFIGTDLLNMAQTRKISARFFVQFPTLLSLAATRDEASAEGLAEMMAEHLEVMGFNFHLGPSLELTPVLEDMTGDVGYLGKDPAFAAKAGSIILAKLWEKRIVATPMGFPGGGANRIGLNPPVLLTAKSIMPQKDLLPYSTAIEKGAPIIHVGNTIVPMLDPAVNTASVSSSVMRRMLREKMGFDGVVLSGPVDVRDIGKGTSASQAAMLALSSGADMVYWSKPGHEVMKAVDEIVREIKLGTMTESSINESVARVLKLKFEYGLAGRELPDARKALKLEQNKKFLEESLRIEKRSITLVKNSNDILPLTKEASVPVGITGVIGLEPLRDALKKPLKYVVQQVISTAKYSKEIHDFEVDRLVRRVEGVNTLILVLSDVMDTPSQIRLLKALRKKTENLVVVLIGYPAMLAELDDADVIITAYCRPEACAQTMAAVADILLGNAPVRLEKPAKNQIVKAGEETEFNAWDWIRCPAGTLPVSVGDAFPAGKAQGYTSSAAIRRVEWEFTDGKKASGESVSWLFSDPGTHPVTLRVTDKEGNMESLSFDVYAE